MRKSRQEQNRDRLIMKKRRDLEVTPLEGRCSGLHAGLGLDGFFLAVDIDRFVAAASLEVDD